MIIVNKGRKCNRKIKITKANFVATKQAGNKAGHKSAQQNQAKLRTQT